MFKRFLWISLYTVLCLGLILPATAEIQTFTVTARAMIGDNQTKNDARQLATLEARRQALERAGTYVESLSLVKNSQLEKDEILAFTGGITRTELLREQAIVEGNSFGIEITASIQVDSAVVEARIQQFITDRSLLEQQQRLLQRNAELEAELKAYREALSRQKDAEAVSRLRQEQGQQLEQRLKATEWVQQGNAAFARQAYPEALQWYNRALEADPRFASAYNNRGLVYRNLNQDIRALEDYHRAIQLDAAHGYYFYNRGSSYFHLNRYHEALADFSRCIELLPRLARAYDYRATTYFRQGNLPAALQDYTRALALESANAAVYERRAQVYFQQQQWAAALNDFNHALLWGPTSAKLLSSRGVAFQMLGEHQKALSDFQQAIQLDPQDPVLYKNRGNAWQYMHNYHEAIADYNLAVQLGLHQDAAVFNNRGAAYAALGYLAEARNDFFWACQLGLQGACVSLRNLP